LLRIERQIARMAGAAMPLEPAMVA
jgi:hypothetical protein